MTCMQCNLHKGGFRSESEFSKFEDLVASLVKSGQLIELGRNSDARFFEVGYRCNVCNAIWALSFPDQSYRGGWDEK